MHVPAELARRPHWIVWKTIKRRCKRTGEWTSAKVPFSPLTRLLASTTSPAAWATLAQAQTAMATNDYAGLGYVFAKDDEIFGVDLDGCRRNLWSLDDWAERLVRTFGTYAEVSPSKGGVKLFGIGEHQRTGCVKFVGEPVPGQKRSAIEVYGWGRFFAFTGEQLDDTPGDLVECREQLAALVKAIDESRPAAARPPAPRHTSPSSLSLLERGRRYLAKVPPATSGSGGHNRTFRAACVLVREIKLPAEDAFALLSEWNADCLPPWSDAELWHKINDAAKPK